MNSRKANLILGITGGSVIALYVLCYFIFPGILHSEVCRDISNLSAGGMHGAKDFIKKSFDLNSIESSHYRPRMLGFMIQYLDTKMWYDLNSNNIQIGGRFLFTLFAMPLVLIGGYIVLDEVFPGMARGEKFFWLVLCL